jgi:hypothetical protein
MNSSSKGALDMAYMGHVKNGAIVLDDPMELPDGTVVRIELPSAGADSGTSFTERFAEVLGQARGLPEDAAENLDHYVYGTPKR